MNNILTYGINKGIIKIIISMKILLGVIFEKRNGRNLILLVISLEIFLLGISLILIHFSFILDDKTGTLISLILLPLAGAESAIALSLLIGYYPKRGTLIT